MKTPFFLAALLAALLLPGCVVVRVADQLALNPVKRQPDAVGTERDRRVHASLFVADLHADTLMLDRGGATGIQKRHTYGHLDLPRLREGNVSLQMLTVASVTPVPYMPWINGGFDGQRILVPLQGWPLSCWFSPHARALHQAAKWRTNTDGTHFYRILTQGDLEKWLAIRAAWLRHPDPCHPFPVASVLGLEGAHALALRAGDSDEKIDARVREFRDAGFRVMALTHRFDNELGGSSEGASAARNRAKGLTPLGHRVLASMHRHGIIIDLAHASDATICDVLKARDTQWPDLKVMVSHTGLAGEGGGQGAERKLSRESARRIVQAGGVIGIGIWPQAVGEATPAATARMIVDALHDPQLRSGIVLGSDMDGAVITAFDASGWALLTSALRPCLTQQELREVMGCHTLCFFQKNLPSR